LIVYKELFCFWQEHMRTSEDFIVRRFQTKAGEQGFFGYLTTLCDGAAITQDIFIPLTACETPGGVAQALRATQVAPPPEPVSAESLHTAVLDGFCVLVMEDGYIALIDERGGISRGVTYPGIDRTIYASHEGFIEQLQHNLTMLRRRLHTPNLRQHTVMLGQSAKLRCVVLYMDDRANPDLVARIIEQLQSLEVDSVPTLAALLPIFGKQTQPFPGARLVERPDSVAANLAEGRVAIMLDQSPFALILPCMLSDLFQSADDYGEQPVVAATARTLRYAGFLMSMFLPAVYVGVMLFQQSLLPPGLLAMLTVFSYQVPFSLILEVLMVELLMLLILEATARLPNITAQAMGIVGGVVLGQALISARIASASTVIIITLATLMNCALPNPHLLNISRILRIGMTLIAAAFGLFGVAMGGFVVALSLARGRSYASPFLTPFAPQKKHWWQDTLIVHHLHHLQKDSR